MGQSGSEDLGGLLADRLGESGLTRLQTVGYRLLGCDPRRKDRPAGTR
jgi:hypothetical protein